MNTESSIFIADDHQLVIDGLAKIIEGESNLTLVGIANDGKEAIRKVPILKPDLVLMDLDMPLLNGMEAATFILRENPNQKIAMLTMHAERSLVEKMAQLGVQGYFLKNVDKQEFVTGIALILSGKKYFQSEALLGSSGIQKQLSTSESEIKLLHLLSEREREVLKWIAQGLTSKEIADQIHISERTVETHRRNIHSKLDIKNMAGLIRFAIKSGLVH